MISQDQFVEARLAEIEVDAARADWQPGKPWTVEYPHGRHGGKGRVWNSSGQSVMSNPHAPTCEHVVNWQPERAMAWIAAIRRIMAAREDYYKVLRTSEGAAAMYVALGEALIDIAYIWKDHSDWNEEWEVLDNPA